MYDAINVETFHATANGKHHMLGLWRTAPTGRTGELRDIAKRALLAVEGFEIKRGMIENDKRRSQIAKNEDVREDALDRLKEMGKAMQSLHERRKAIEAEAASLMAVKPYAGDAAAALIDLALAERLRNMDIAERNAALIIGADRDLINAVLRLPPALTDVSPELRARVMRTTLERERPIEAQEHEDLQIALQDATAILQRSFQVVKQVGGISLDEQVVAAGTAEAAHELVKTHPVAIDSISDRVLNKDDNDKEQSDQAA